MPRVPAPRVLIRSQCQLRFHWRLWVCQVGFHCQLLLHAPFVSIIGLMRTPPSLPHKAIPRCGRKGIEETTSPISLNIRSNRCLANMAHIRQSRPDPGLAWQQSFNLIRDSLFPRKRFPLSLLGGESIVAIWYQNLCKQRGH